MRLTATNALVQINATSPADFDRAMKVAHYMVEDSGLEWIEADDCEQYIVLSSTWNHYQAQDWRDLYAAAKGSV